MLAELGAVCLVVGEPSRIAKEAALAAYVGVGGCSRQSRRGNSRALRGRNGGLRGRLLDRSREVQMLGW